MTKEQHLKEIINYEDCEKRIEKSKYFTEEFFKKCEIKKYRNLLEEYEIISFKWDTFFQISGIKDPQVDIYLFELNLRNENLEEEFNVLMASDEYSHSLKENSESQEIDYYLTNNFIPILDGYKDEHIFISKDTKEVWFLHYIGEEERWEWKKLANTFDEFIDKLYYIPDENEEEFEEKVEEFYNNFVEMMEKK